MEITRLNPKKKKPDKLKVCAYVRVSTANERQGESFENQVQYYEKYIKHHPDYDFVGVFADKAMTGTKGNRPEFQKMLEKCRDGNIGLILTKAISRFARNTITMLETVRELKELGVAVHFEKENINTLSGDGELMLAVLSSFAQEESRDVRESIRWGIQEKFRRGVLLVNTNKFLGYDKDSSGNLIINEAEAKIVRRIFDDYIGGKGAAAIAKELNEDHIPSQTGGRWNESTIKAMIKNEKFKGDALLQKTYTPEYNAYRTKRNDGVLDSYYVKGNHPAIVPEEVWDRAQEIRKERAAAKGNFSSGRNKYAKRYPLSGKLFCSKCGHTLIRRTWNSKYGCKKIVWQCNNYIRNGKNACTGTVVEDDMISKENIIDPTIVEEVRKDGRKCYVYTSKKKSTHLDDRLNKRKRKWQHIVGCQLI